MIHVHLFANIRERIGCAELNYEYCGEETVSEVKEHLVARGENWKYLQEQDVLMAVNQTLCGPDKNINDGDELAFFPPVTGG